MYERRSTSLYNCQLFFSMFLQNLTVVSPNTTITSILGPKRRRRRSDNDDNDRLDLLPTLLAAIQTHSNNDDLAFSVFGLLSNVALHTKGIASLRSLNVYTIAVEAVRKHPSHLELQNVAFSLFHHIGNDTNDERTTLDLADLVMKSIVAHPNEEMLQMNARKVLQDLLRGDGNDCCDEIVTLARENYPNCTDLVDELLQNN